MDRNSRIITLLSIIALLGTVILGIGAYSIFRYPSSNKFRSDNGNANTNYSPITQIATPTPTGKQIPLKSGLIPVNKAWTYIGKLKGNVHITVTGEAILYPLVGPTDPNGWDKIAPVGYPYPLPGANLFCALIKYNDHVEKLGRGRTINFPTETDVYFGPNEEDGGIGSDGPGFADNKGAWSYQIDMVK
ncbi:MAG TPA: hypothetical protein VLJ61_00540 [Pyrinomonadaceae bacterium]|nr:hypothetical protein [Pyrinomonadaceae bacterium]